MTALAPPERKARALGLIAVNGDDPDFTAEEAADESERINLPAEFWDARPHHVALRQFAHAAGCPADSMLGSFLARLSASVPPSVVGPKPVGRHLLANRLPPSRPGSEQDDKNGQEEYEREKLEPDRRLDIQLPLNQVNAA